MKNKILLSLAQLILFSFGIFSQNNQWVIGLPGNTSADVAYDVEVDSLGNTYVGGNFQGTIDFNPGPGVSNLTATGGGWDIFLAKYDVNGNYLWAFKIPGVGGNDVINHIAVDSKGDCYITGWFAGTNVDFDPGAGVANVSSGGGNDIFVAKYTANGNYQWAFAIGKTGADVGNGIAVDASGNCYVTGNFSGSNVSFNPAAGTALLSSSGGSSDAFVAKYSTNGLYQWAFTIGNTGADIGWGVAVDMNSDVYITGNFSGTNVDFDPASTTATISSNSGSSDIYVAKYTSAGNYLWAIKAGGNSSDIGFAIAVDFLGNAYVSGTFQGTSDFDPSASSANITSSGSDDIFVAKYTASGNYAWAFKIGGSGGDNSWYKSTDIAVDCAANVYVAGAFASSNVDFDPGAGSVLFSSAGSKDIFAAQYTTNGNYLCALKVGQSNEDDAYGIAVSLNGCHVVGRFQGTNMNFNPSGSTPKNMTSSVWSDLFVGKYDMCQPPVLNFANIVGAHDVCAGQSLTLTASGGGTYLWNNSSTTASVNVTPSANTTYSVIVTTGRFCRDTAYAPVSIFPAVALNVSPDAAVCFGKSITVTAAGAANYIWSPTTGLNSTNGSLVVASPTAATTYSVTGTDANGCTATAVVNINVHAIPTLSVTGNTSMCKSFSNVLSVTGATSYIWIPSASLNTNTGWIVTATPSATTTYSVTGTDNNGCTATTSMQLTVNASPVINVNPPVTICNGNSATLNVSGAVAYNWLPIAITGNAINVNPSTTSTYTVIGEDANGCKDTATTTVNVNQLPLINTTQGVSACIGSSATLSANGAINYSWQPGNINSQLISVSPTTTTTYTVIATDNNGCSNTATTVLTINPLPLVSVSSNAIICNGSNTTLTASGAVAYLWSPANSLNTNTGSSVIATPSAATTYSVTATDINGCTNTASVNITLNIPLSGLVSQDTAVCFGNPAVISAAGQGGGAAYFYNWQPVNLNTQNIIVSPSATTNYTVTITDNCGSTPYSKEVTVVVNALPVVSFTSDSISGCGPLCVNFSNTTTGAQNIVWNFGDGNTSTLFTPVNCYNDAGSYNVSLAVTDANGCSDSLSITNYITVFPNPVAGFSYSPEEITILNADVYFKDESIGANNWIWLFGDAAENISNEQNPLFTYPDTGSFMAQQIVINEFGCKDTTEKIIRIHPDFIIYVPNTFTPNGDSHNEIFMPLGVGLDVQHYDLYIFDRWGDLIFHSEHPGMGWDGHSNGGSQLSQQDTYVWKIELKDVLGDTHRYTGHVNLIR